MKVLFLDMDGVVNNTVGDDFVTLPMLNHDGKMCYSTLFSGININPFCKLLDWLQKDDIKIVISSTWRLTMTPELFNKYFRNYFRNYQKDLVVGLTTVSVHPKYMHRGTEIKDYLDKHQDIEEYIVIDDDIDDIVDTLPQHRVVKINKETGLTDRDISKIQYMWFNNKGRVSE